MGVTGYLIYKGVQAGVQIYNSGGILPNQTENQLVDRIARELCVDRNAWGEAIHEWKDSTGNFPLSEQEIEELARALPKTQGCTLTNE